MSALLLVPAAPAAADHGLLPAVEDETRPVLEEAGTHLEEVLAFAVYYVDATDAAVDAVPPPEVPRPPPGPLRAIVFSFAQYLDEHTGTEPA